MASHCSGCVSVHCCVCTLDGLIAEHKFRAWVTIICAWQRPDGQNIAIFFFYGTVNSVCGHYVCSLTILGHMSLPFKSSIYLNVQNQQRIKTFFIFYTVHVFINSHTQNMFNSVIIFSASCCSKPCLFLL